MINQRLRAAVILPYFMLKYKYSKEEFAMKLNKIGTCEILTERLVLRRFSITDVNSAFKNWASDKNIQTMYGEPTYNSALEVEELLNKYISAYDNELNFSWAIATKENPSECIGQIAYFSINEENLWGEIEYCVGSAYQNKGLMTEAVKAIINFGFNKIHLHKIAISHKENNLPSKRVIEKCGFKYEGTLRDYFYNDGKFISRIYYSILDYEYK